jgi:primosomal protein N' (replication factor Y)
MDADTTRSRDAPRQLYESIKTQAIDVLVGTQLVAKGLDLPQVTLVGVVSADTALNLPDFRAGERTFDLLTQVAGRAGRGDRPGEVLIQTYCPDHYAIQAASRHDYQTFYRAEIRMRKRLKLPPVVHLVELTIQGGRRERVEAAAQSLANTLRATMRGSGVALLGPAPHRLVRLRGTFRWRLVLKAPSVVRIGRLVRRVLKEGRRFHGLPVIVDVDPL